jgi:hypothetical protein
MKGDFTYEKQRPELMKEDDRDRRCDTEGSRALDGERDHRHSFQDYPHMLVKMPTRRWQRQIKT